MKVIYFLSLAITLLVVGCDNQTQNEPYNVTNSEIKVIESGTKDGGNYDLFLDTKTGKRIFWYHHAMVVLPDSK